MRISGVSRARMVAAAPVSGEESSGKVQTARPAMDMRRRSATSRVLQRNLEAPRAEPNRPEQAGRCVEKVLAAVAVRSGQTNDSQGQELTRAIQYAVAWQAMHAMYAANARALCSCDLSPWRPVSRVSTHDMREW